MDMTVYPKTLEEVGIVGKIGFSFFMVKIKRK